MRSRELRARLQASLAAVPTGTSDGDLDGASAGRAEVPLRPAAVLVAFQPAPRGWQLLLTKRASGLRHHPGQIAFPGGKVDPEDDGPVGAALREAQEEIGLPGDTAEILGRLPAHVTFTGYAVTPVLAMLGGPFVPVPALREVEEVFAVPADHVLTSANYRVESRLWKGRPRHYFTVPFGPYYIWGATARILRAICEKAGAASGEDGG